MGMYYGCVCDICETEIRLPEDIQIPKGWTLAHVRLNTGKAIFEKDVTRCPECSMKLFGSLYQQADYLPPASEVAGTPPASEGSCTCSLAEELGQQAADDSAACLHSSSCKLPISGHSDVL